MKTIGSPFQIGTLSNVLLGAVATSIMIYFFIKRGSLDYKYLLFVVVGLAGTGRSYFRYRRLRFQNELEFIDERAE